MNRAFRPIWLVVLVAILVGAIAWYRFGGEESPESPNWERLVDAGDAPGDWITYGGTFDEQRFSRLTAISDKNAGQLGLAWSFRFDTNRVQETTPLEYDGVLYATSAWSKVFALDAKTGREIWSFDPEVPRSMANKGCCDVGNRGVAMFDGKLYLGTFDGRLIALDMKTGKPVWSTVTVDQSQPYTITGAPRIVKGKVLIGNGGAELGVRGYVTAYDAQTGEQAWRFYTVPGNPAKGPDKAASDAIMASTAAKTWHGEFWKAGGGGTVWDSIVYDVELDQLYIGVGNGAPWNHRIRSDGKGDNLFLSSIVALDPDTGEYRWHYQGTPAETWDFTHTQTITLATLNIGGEPRKILMQAPKNGFFYVIDRTNGKLISADNFVHVNWATGYDLKTGRPIENPEARYEKGPFLAFPGALGAHNWQPMAFSPQTKLAYIPAQDAPFFYEETDYYKYRPGLWNLGVDLAGAVPPDDPAQFKAVRASLKGALVAWDPVKKQEAWRFDYPGVWNSGILATAGNLVFQGDVSGKFRALTADEGKVLWTFDTGLPILGSPVTFEADGEQYVAVATGYGGAFALSSAFTDDPRPQPDGRLLVFRIGGDTALPPISKIAVAPANPSADSFTPEQINQGMKFYENQCFTCHGTGGISSGILPDLRRSGALTDRKLWQDVVIDGLLKDQGMVSFSKVLSPAEAEAIRGYISKRAKILQQQEAGGAK